MLGGFLQDPAQEHTGPRRVFRDEGIWKSKALDHLRADTCEELAGGGYSEGSHVVVHDCVLTPGELGEHCGLSGARIRLDDEITARMPGKKRSNRLEYVLPPHKLFRRHSRGRQSDLRLRTQADG